MWNTLSTSALIAFLTMVACARESYGQDKSLFLLSGTNLPGSDLPVRLYRVRPNTGHKPELVRDVAAGLDCVLTDFDTRRLFVVASWLANGISIIDMNSPAMDVSGPVNYDRDEAPVGIYLIDIPEKGEGVALALGRIDQGKYRPPESLFFVGMKSLRSPIPIPLSNVRFLRYSGFVGGALTSSQAPPDASGDPLKISIGRPEGVSLGISAPSYLKGRETARSLVILSSSQSLVTLPLTPPEPGVVDIFDRNTGAWRRQPIPFQAATIRAFGDWLGLIEKRNHPQSENSVRSGGDTLRGVIDSTGREKRRSEPIASPFKNHPPLTVGDLFDSMNGLGEYYPGELALFNIRTNAQLKITTGVGDSEILLANDELVFYRIDDEIYSRSISGASLGPAVLVAAGPEIVQVHWAFMN